MAAIWWNDETAFVIKAAVEIGLALRLADERVVDGCVAHAAALHRRISAIAEAGSWVIAGLLPRSRRASRRDPKAVGNQH